jgi:hypothetical protein
MLHDAGRVAEERVRARERGAQQRVQPKGVAGAAQGPAPRSRPGLHHATPHACCLARLCPLAPQVELRMMRQGLGKMVDPQLEEPLAPEEQWRRATGADGGAGAGQGAGPGPGAAAGTAAPGGGAGAGWEAPGACRHAWVRGG